MASKLLAPASVLIFGTYKRCCCLVTRIKSRNPDQESSFTEASPELYSDFFTALRANSSITKISVRATQDGEPFSTQKIRLFFENVSLCLAKDKLKEIELKEIKLEVSGELRKAVERATSPLFKRAFESVHTVKLDILVTHHNLTVTLRPHLTELHLTGLELGSNGFGGLVHLIQKSKNLKKLSLSMNKEALIKANTPLLTSTQLEHTALEATPPPPPPLPPPPSRPPF
ncbi:hypothetical protein Pcinc_022906 [Petrolisthes cinctipes]|uniref:Uncharacterized protein n=1 Tax=Petrolisthes cinctipes TaxID=88211 RepID=A0AAE1FE63_PETCI|nr:hypothetical protein Pcinc_022906 [Petrolisthes cinctipes]KAK3871977.1 hypothetical protein Pcinc_022906 [Petrolisthes cinctipes]